VFDDGTALDLLFKNVSLQGLSPIARAAKPAFLYEPMREILTYRNVLATERMGTATCYGSVADPSAGRYWLFLEKVAGTELYQVGEFEVWQEAARWLAALHCRLAATVEALGNAVPLIRHDRDWYHMWLHRAKAIVNPDLTDGGKGPMAERLIGSYDRVVDRLLSLPATLLHGEFFAPNVLVRELPAGPRICPVDWELAGCGPGLMDLAALTAGTWSDEERTALAMAYHSAYPKTDGWPPSPDAFLEAFDFCRLQLAIQRTGWATGWSPPSAQSQDWLGQALALAEKLGL
jgi:aminoglycoside phosphotransferase (APT) family kinase protein